eukprot:1296500-Pyramimonas_sp.AAC.2
MLACPAHQLYAFAVIKAWKPTLSDRAILYLQPGGAGRARRDCTMKAGGLRNLPTAAHADLR